MPLAFSSFSWALAAFSGPPPRILLEVRIVQGDGRVPTYRQRAEPAAN
jgi:hypothetical protein